jgi:DNA-binding MarR family transcriptional regulator
MSNTINDLYDWFDSREVDAFFELRLLAFNHVSINTYNYIASVESISITDLADKIGVEVTTAYYMVKRLEKVGLIKTQKVGKYRYCRINPEGIESIMTKLNSINLKPLINE